MRESMRWEQLQAAQQAEAERWQHVREAGLKGKQNKSSEHYNIISLNYHPTREGETLRMKVSHMHASMHSRERGPVCHVVASRNREKQAFNTHQETSVSTQLSCGCYLSFHSAACYPAPW